MRRIFRNLRGHAGLALTVVVTLTVALAFAVASLAILNGLLLHPYPYPKLRQLLLVRDSKPRDGAHQGRSIAVGDFLDARDDVAAFSSLAAWRPQPIVITRPGADPERVQSAAATANFFATLGIAPLHGRPFAADADAAGRDGVVVLSRRLWNSRFGADISVVGREIGVNGRPMTVVGIIKDEDCYPPGVDAWVPLVFTPSERVERAAQRVAAIGLLADNATEAEAAGRLAALSRTLESRYPLTNRGRGFELLPMQREQYEFTAPLFLFVLGAAFLVLLIAVINVSNLLAARTLDRRRELAVRTMLGASAVQIASVVSGEILIFVAAAAAGSLFAAVAALNAIRASLPEGIARWIAGWTSLRVDAAAMTAGTVVAVLVALLLCVLVGTVAHRIAGQRAETSHATRRMTWGRRVVVAGQASLAVALLLGASVMVAGFNRIASAFDELAPARLLKFALTLPELRYPDSVQIAGFHAALLDRLRALPDVEGVALIRNEPASNVPNPIIAFQRADAPPLQPSDMPRIDVEVVSPMAFETFRLETLAGRALGDGDGAEAPRVAVVSQTAVRRFWPDRNPVGTTIRIGNDLEPLTVVGVVSDFILNWYDPEKRPVLFLPDAQSPSRTTTVMVRTRIDPIALARPVRATVAQLDNRQPLTELEPLTTTIADSLSPIRIIERLLLIGAVIASLLAALGIYGALAHWVRARRRELGIRLALGATRTSIARLVLREALLTASAGILVGMALAAGFVRLAGGALLGVPSLEIRALAIVLICGVSLAVAGGVGPARRAAHVNVEELLRFE
jgi:putative ABC transport system permease protein